MEADTPETDGRGSAVDTLYGLYTKNLLFPVGEDEGAIPQWKSEDQYGRRTLDITLLYGIVATCGMAAVFWAVLQYAIYEWSAPVGFLCVTGAAHLCSLAQYVLGSYLGADLVGGKWGFAAHVDRAPRIPSDNDIKLRIWSYDMADT
eukprot:9486222-Pyramimonas_sp.AAC.1